MGEVEAWRKSVEYEGVAVVVSRYPIGGRALKEKVKLTTNLTNFTNFGCVRREPEVRRQL
jgi:hypothetical protein